MATTQKKRARTAHGRDKMVPVPQAKWPLRKGCYVYYVVTRLVVGAPYIAEGRVRHYFRDTAGGGFTLTVLRGTDFGDVQVSGEKYTFRRTKAGYKQAARTIAQMHFAAAKSHLKAAKHARAMARDYLAAAQ
jgi:hypothetical protein